MPLNPNFCCNFPLDVLKYNKKVWGFCMNSLLGIRNILIKGEFKSDIFSSLCDEISLSLKAQCTADCRIEIVSLNSGSEESIVYDEKYTDCEVSFKYSFDPISLAVYRGAEKFFVRIVSDGEISVLELEIYENNANTGEEDTSSLNNTGIGEDGVKVAYVYDKYGTCSEVHRTPVRVLFIGNSLVFGMGKRYGMCASHPDKDYFFIIDEINRGELSKIFGELFFAIDPGYRGNKKPIKTQYQNLVPQNDPFANGFFVPDNVFIIGTMNDIDRSVESMDFAIRRRFAWKEISADERESMLDEIIPQWADNAKLCMHAINQAIEKIAGLSKAYHIGPAYFKNLKNYDGDFSQLWEFHIEGILREYLRGTRGVDEKVDSLRKVFLKSVGA